MTKKKKEDKKDIRFHFKPSLVGRPKMFKTPEEFIEKAEEYFRQYRDREIGRISWTGLCLAVGASGRQSLERYKNGEHGKEYVDPIKKALAQIEKYYEEGYSGNGEAKEIFILKNFNWTDKQENVITPGQDDKGDSLKWTVEVVKAEDKE